MCLAKDRTMSQQSPPYDVSYMQRTRDYYRAQGYENAYRWASAETRPFAELKKPLDQCRLAAITTAMPDTPQGRSRREVYALPCFPLPESMFTAELSWDKLSTHTDDLGTFLPLAALADCVAQGELGALSESFLTLPTEYSQRNTLERDAPAILDQLRRETVDIALLVPL